ncbi:MULTISPECIES: 2-hydroxy-3-oxopropionate reductase [Gordonia]|uniref:Tartronate semialdehyde reductase n=1 Tax=Gordonia jacobaea TaxID=122202 RepID=A0ABR5IDN6_9ACTN|nr:MULTISPECIES: 2-hydroxy-3-oxopropionate reductase [Gordonia]KNA91832.1 tartronate semialdehyde reductase [Gordonia jacobaea]OBC04982.1 2-hydroxy-3-oxopropionate reductase [Gordonia sp. 852002-50395_SCH5434458]OBC16987.1 2-hydroxy-3-oxopropionate reductase [Gordonia sp. 852002-50816_SCH5313054-c]OBC20085.1 2-hydroxy-3-oxopropionate reductase [Gordonia sp. 852002-50816_SCH5313054-a]
MTTLAFIGLGVMGSPMSVNAVRAGHRVVGYNRTPSKAAALVEAGGTAVHSVPKAVADADIVATVLPDSPDVEQTMNGPDGVFAHAKPGTVIVDFSTVRPDVAVRLADQAAERGHLFLDAPVSGGEEGAVNATLSIMVGGSDQAVEAAAPLLHAVGSTVVHVGPSGSGQLVKAANQLIVAANIAALAEALVYLEASGVQTTAAVEVLGGGLAGSTVLDHKARRMIDRDFAPGARIDLHHKDLGIVTASAREAGLALPIGSLVATLMASARANGDGGLDHAALFRTVERLSGRLDSM